MSTNVMTGKCRASYVTIAEPRSYKGSAPKYSISLIIPKSDTKTIDRIKAAIEEAKEKGIAEKWGGKLPSKMNFPLHDGDVERPDDRAYANSYYVNATSKEKPGIVDRKCHRITDPLVVYSGCYVRASINFYAYSAPGNNGISAGLTNVQFWADGEPLNGRRRAEDEFTVLDDEDDDFLN